KEHLFEDALDGALETDHPFEGVFEAHIRANTGGFARNDARAEIVREWCDHEHRAIRRRNLDRDPRFWRFESRQVEGITQFDGWRMAPERGIGTLRRVSFERRAERRDGLHQLFWIGGRRQRRRGMAVV